MIGIHHLLAFLFLAAAPGAAPVPPGDDEIAAQVESAVLARHRDIPLQRYARFYAHLPDGRVRAVYVFSNEGYPSTAGTPGEREWVDVARLPEIADGGCTVLNLEYDVRAGRLRSLDCNGPGGE